MKKIFALLLALLMLAGLCACGAAETEETAESSEETALVEETVVEEAASASDVTVRDVQTEEVSALDEEKFAAAEGCIGESADTLIETIGEPSFTEYASSCMEMNAEDGVLYYTQYGFYVFTLRSSDGTETVMAVLDSDFLG